MTIGGLFLSFLPQAALWYWLRRLRIGGGAERVALAIGFGLALTSGTYFLARWMGLTPFWYALTECAVAAMALGAGIVYPPSQVPEGSRPGATCEPLVPAWVVGAVVFLIAGLSVAVVSYHLVSHPEGTWDAWAIWNARAAFLAQPSGAWRLAFDPALAASHPDYPLLLPGAVARAWVFAGSQPAWIPALIAVAFTIATALMVAGGLWRRRGPEMGLVALALLMTPEFLFLGSAQIADVPLAFFAVAAVILAAGASPLDPSRLMLAGFACGCAAWTKNEGLVLALAWPMVVVASVGWRSGRGAAASAAADLIIGAGPFLVLLAVFKLVLAPPNDVVSGLLAPGALGYWADTTRVTFVAREMALGLFSWGGWPGPLSAVAVLGAVALVSSRRGPGPPVGLLLVAQLLAFFAIYVMTPHSVAWHIQTSWPRLVAQMWPTMVWWILARGTPGPPYRLRDRLVVTLGRVESEDLDDAAGHQSASAMTLRMGPGRFVTSTVKRTLPDGSTAVAPAPTT